MAIHLLGDDPVKIPQKPGTYADGKGLYVRVRAKGQGSWTVVFGKTERCIGPSDLIRSEEARELHKQMRLAKKAGRDPWSLMSASREIPGMIAGPAQPASASFGSLIEPYLALNAPPWKGGVDGHEAGQYRKTLAGMASFPVATVGSSDVQKHLESFPPSRADKVRMRVMGIISYAVAKGLRADGENPARKEVMKHLVASAPKTVPHPSMPIGDVPAFVAKLITDGSDAARSLAFCILTAARTGEALGAQWSEIDHERNVWTLPPSRMKEGIEHSVPLARVVLDLLGKPGKGRVFGDLPHDALHDKLREYTSEATVHGMRAAFNGFAVKNKYPKELWGRALAHAQGTKTDRAYDREALIEERRPLMEAWAAYLAG